MVVFFSKKTAIVVWYGILDSIPDIESTVSSLVLVVSSSTSTVLVPPLPLVLLVLLYCY